MQTIDRAEWDFSAVRQDELVACIDWEYPRSVPAIRDGVIGLREQGEPDLACVVTEHVQFEEWPDVPFSRLPRIRRQLFRLERFNDEGLPRDLEAALDLQEGEQISPSQLQLVLAYAKKYGDESALRVPTSYWLKPTRRRGDKTPELALLKLDLTKSDDWLFGAFGKYLKDLRRKRGVEITELRGASNAFSQARSHLKHLAAARLIRAMPWEEAYLQTLDALGHGLYADRPEVWKRAAFKGEKLLAVWEKEFTTFFKSED